MKTLAWLTMLTVVLSAPLAAHAQTTPEATFELRESRLAGQTQVPACVGCRFEAICPGVRPDYLEQFGDAEIAATRGQAPSRVGRVRLAIVTQGARGPV